MFDGIGELSKKKLADTICSSGLLEMWGFGFLIVPHTQIQYNAPIIKNTAPNSIFMAINHNNRVIMNCTYHKFQMAVILANFYTKIRIIKKIIKFK